MAQQLTFFGPAEPIRSTAAPRSVETTPVPAPDAISDPRQYDLFDGPLADLLALEVAFERRDVGAAREAWAGAVERFPEWAGGQLWPDWIEDLAWLAGDPHAPEELLARASSLETAASGETGRFPEMAAGLRTRIACAVIADAAVLLIARDGFLARSPDGRPAGWLLARAGRPEHAAVALARSVAEQPDDGRLRGYLAEALWRAGREREALDAYRDACVLSTEAIDEEVATCTPILDLVDRAADLELPAPASAWVSVLADLEGLIPILDAPGGPPGPSREAVERLLELRQRQRRGALAEGERIALKRALLRAAPELRELVRRL